MKKRPLDMIPDPVPAWKSATYVGGVFAAVVLGRLFYGVLGPSDVEHVGAIAAATPASSAPAKEARVVPEPEGESEGDDHPESDVAGAPKGTTSASPSPVGSQTASGSPTSSPSPGSVASPPPGDPAALSPNPTPTPPTPMSEGQRRRAAQAERGLRLALGEGRVHATSRIFMTVNGSERTWDGASAHCRSKLIDGIGNWTLASRTELRALHRAGEPAGGAYWSRNTDPDDPDSAFAYDVVRGASVLWLKQEPNGAAVCTQPRAPEEEVRPTTPPAEQPETPAADAKP